VGGHKTVKSVFLSITYPWSWRLPGLMAGKNCPGGRRTQLQHRRLTLAVWAACSASHENVWTLLLFQDLRQELASSAWMVDRVQLPDG